MTLEWRTRGAKERDCGIDGWEPVAIMTLLARMEVAVEQLFVLRSLIDHWMTCFWALALIGEILVASWPYCTHPRCWICSAAQRRYWPISRREGSKRELLAKRMSWFVAWRKFMNVNLDRGFWVVTRSRKNDEPTCLSGKTCSDCHSQRLLRSMKRTFEEESWSARLMASGKAVWPNPTQIRS